MAWRGTDFFMLKRLVRYKIYYDRARGYIGAAQFLMLAVIMAKQFGLKLGVFGSICLVASFFAGCLVVGYIDTRLGIREEEIRNSNEQNPEIMEILKILKSGNKDDCGDSGTRKAASCEGDVKATISKE
jgi:hypothetical protein